MTVRPARLAGWLAWHGSDRLTTATGGSPDSRLLTEGTGSVVAYYSVPEKTTLYRPRAKTQACNPQPYTQEPWLLLPQSGAIAQHARECVSADGAHLSTEQGALPTYLPSCLGVRLSRGGGAVLIDASCFMLNLVMLRMCGFLVLLQPARLARCNLRKFLGCLCALNCVNCRGRRVGRADERQHYRL